MKLENEMAGPGSGPVAGVARSRGLSPGRAAVLEMLRWLPLASAGDLAPILGRLETGVLADLREARMSGLVDSGQLGCTRGQCQRWFLTDPCLSQSGLVGATWHDEAARCRLLEILPAVEGFYPVVGGVRNLGGFRQFQWLDALGDEGPSCDAAVLYEEGWIALFHCGRLLRERHLAERLVRFPLDCQAWAVGSPQPWPSQIHFIAADEWGRELAMRAAADFGLEPISGFWCSADGTGAAPENPGTGRGWIFQPVRKRQAQRDSWLIAVEGCPWSGAGGLVSARVLGEAVQWPGAHLRFLRALLRESGGAGRVGRMCRQLADDGLVLRSGEGRAARHFAAGKGLGLMSYQDRIHHLDAWSSTQLSQWPEANRTSPRRAVSPAHEDGLREVIGAFAAAGCPVANGHRYLEHLGSEGGIAPDAMVYLTVSPFGEGWHYLEYERSARYKSRVARKLRGYGSRRRRDGYPVVLVCWDKGAEGEFQAQGRLLGVRLATTTIERLRDHGPLHPDRCWSVSGQPARLG